MKSPRRVTAQPPGPGQESVWDYPRPPVLSASGRHVVVRLLQADSADAGVVLADTTRAVRVLETSHPPTWYLPREDVADLLRPSSRASTSCEFKGAATYWDVLAPAGVLEAVAWSYEDPTPAFAPIAGWITVYPSRFACTVDDEVVRPQEGGFYGGWLTDDVVGPFKGAPGTWGW